MAKFRHTPEALAVIEDVSNRIRQLMEVNEMYAISDGNKRRIDHQNRAFEAVLTILNQVKDNGHVFRGNDFFPDPVEPLAKTKWSK